MERLTFSPTPSVEEGREYLTYFSQFPPKISFRVYLPESMSGRSTGSVLGPNSFIH